MTSEPVSLIVNGNEFRGWKAVSVSRSMEAIAGKFSLKVSEKWVGQAVRWPIREGDECELRLGGDTVITGRVDSRSVAFDANSHDVTISGRDATAVLVDSSVVLDVWQLEGASVETIIKKVLRPFGIPFTSEVSPVPATRNRFALNPGETCFEAIARLCKMAGVLPTPDGRGGLVLTRAGTARAATALVEGENIKSASGDFSHEGRFSRYIVTGQQPGDDETYGVEASEVEATATDPAVVDTNRVLMVVAENIVTVDQAQERANWEASVRAGQSATVQVTVQGWRMGDGTLWPVNRLVPVRSERLGIDGDMLIVEATHSLDETGGTTTALSLKRADAYLPQPEVPEDTFEDA